jgi:hypothetical protein
MKTAQPIACALLGLCCLALGSCSNPGQSSAASASSRSIQVKVGGSSVARSKDLDPSTSGVNYIYVVAYQFYSDSRVGGGSLTFNSAAKYWSGSITIPDVDTQYIVFNAYAYTKENGTLKYTGEAEHDVSSDLAGTNALWIPMSPTISLQSGSVSGETLDLSGALQTYETELGALAMTTDGTYLYAATSDGGIIRINILSGVSETIVPAKTFIALEGIACVDGALYVSDEGACAIYKVAYGSGAWTSKLFAGSGDKEESDNSDPMQAAFDYPAAMCYMNGILYIIDSGGGAIRTISLGSEAVGTLHSFGTDVTPTSIATNGSLLYVSAYDYQTSKTFLSSITTSGAETAIDCGDIGIIWGLACDDTYIYASTSNTKVLDKITPASEGATVATLRNLSDLTDPIAICSEGLNLFLSDIGAGTIYKLTYFNVY